MHNVVADMREDFLKEQYTVFTDIQQNHVVGHILQLAEDSIPECHQAKRPRSGQSFVARCTRHIATSRCCQA